jgi:hypothetical protein
VLHGSVPGTVTASEPEPLPGAGGVELF